ncbi:SAM domain-containing protein SAMSN-1b [Archocentrus centrarchus]|uniref:SAM domain-containing protein SAMSN-1b n=1 Tax=Archocentrus centrarchus TaxID=63155 RepID=UPI0011EA14BD|nr:SAM domain-containing protein SAMSN-1-like [Archocentrus centrarchus]
MNLFCFTLEGSTESMYEPANNQKLKEVLPKYHFSPVLLRRNAGWGGSDPSITSIQPQGKIKLKRDSKRSGMPTPLLEKEILEKDIHHTCWMSCGDKKDLFHQTKAQKEEMCEATCLSSKLTTEDSVRNRTRLDLPAQGTKTTADTSESIKTTRRLRKLQNLVQTKSGAGKGKSTSKSNDSDVGNNNNPVLTCMGRRRRTERRLSKTASLPQQLMQQQARDLHKDPEEDGTWSPRVGNYLWSPFDYPQIHTSFYQKCHEPRHELCGLRHTTEWDRFETLMQEMDRKQSSLSPPQMIHSITDLHLYQNTLTRFERFEALRQHPPLMKPQDNESCPQTWEQNGELTKSRPQRTEMESLSQSDRRHVEASPEETRTIVSNRHVQKGEAEKREADRGRPITKARSRSTNSLESLYSLNSGQSSSSGVTSGSDCSSNRNSLRLEDDLLCTRQFCGRARVHTEYVPSPYDTESLKLTVGDVIDIIAKPPMGIWTGMLNGRVGNFKFIYVDVLRKETSGTHLETHLHRVRHKSTVQEVLKRLSLEEYSTCLQLGGYQTVDDLMRLRENHLMELNVTDPEHRQRLLAAVNSLQQLRSGCQLENEADREAGSSSENRDSGCPMPSDSPDSITEEAHLHFLSDATAS